LKISVSAKKQPSPQAIAVDAKRQYKELFTFDADLGSKAAGSPRVEMGFP